MRELSFKRIFTLLLSVALIVTLLPTGAFAAAGAKDLDGHWSVSAIESCHTYGIMNGDGNGDYMPNADITRAEFAAMVNRAFGYAALTVPELIGYTDVSSDKWYASDMATTIALGIIEGYGNGIAAPEDKITREQAAVILYKILRLSASDTATKFTDLSEVSSWATDAVLAMEASGYIQGYNNQFIPKGNITRGEAAQLLLNVVGVIVDSDFDAKGSKYKNVTVRKAGVSLSNAVITGDLFITEGVGDGDVWLDTVKIDGRLLAAGGGENSIHVSNITVGDNVVVDKPSVAGEQPVRFRAIQTNDTTVIFQGTAREVIVSDDIIIFIDMDGEKTIFNMFKPEDGTAKPNVVICENSAVEKVTAYVPTEITGGGEVGKLEAHANGVTVDAGLNIKPENIEAKKGVEVKVGGETVTGTGISEPTTKLSDSISPTEPTPAPAYSPDPSPSPNDNGGSSSGGGNNGTTYYTVTFNSTGGSAVDSKSVALGSRVAEPTVPTKANYTFGGWYKESALANVWNFTSDTVTGSITLYAKWIQNLTNAEKVAGDKAALTFDVIKGSNTAEDNIKTNLTNPLPSTGSVNGSTITWSSDTTSVIGNDGTVTRPSHTENDTTVILTATITNGSESDTKDFVFTVKALVVTGIAVKTQPAKMVYVNGDTLDLSGVVVTLTFDNSTTADVSFVNLGVNNITTSLANGTVLSGINDNHPVTVIYDNSVTIRAATNNLTVNLTDVEKVAGDKAALSFDVIKEGNSVANNITGNLNLPDTGSINGSTITWSTNDASAISNGGTVTRPPHTGTDKTVTLTATIQNGGASDTQIFMLTVKALLVTGITVKTQPSKLEYMNGNTLDLTGIAVTLTFDDGTTADVALVNFAANLITTSPVSGAVLSRAMHDNNPITVIYNNSTIRNTTANLTVILTDAEKVAEDKAALTFDVIKGSNTTQTDIKTNLISPLPSTGNTQGSTITWSINDTAIGNDGTVTRPSHTEGDKTVTLTATITNGGASETKTFTLTVKALTVTGIAVKTQPTKSIYLNGDALDLTGIVVRLSFDTGATADVALTDFGANLITTSPANGTILSHTTHDGTSVKVIYNGGSIQNTTSVLTVNKAPGSFGSPGALNTTYTPTLTLGDVTPPSGYAWNNPGTSLSVGDGQLFNATYTDTSGNYETVNGTITVNVAKATPTTALLNYDLTAVDYNGTAKSVSATAKGGVTGLGGITVKYNGSTNAPTNAGTYTVTVDIAAGDNYTAVTGLSLGNFTINYLNLTAADFNVSENTKTYNGNPQGATVAFTGTGLTSTTAGTFTVYYYNVSYVESTTVPTNAGTYDIKVKTTGGTGYSAITTSIKVGELTIGKAAAPSITFPNATTITYGAVLSTSTLNGGSTVYGSFAWTNETTVPTVTNNGYSVTFTPNANTLANYETIATTTQTVAITVNKAVLTLSVTGLDIVLTPLTGETTASVSFSTNAIAGNSASVTLNTTTGVTLSGTTLTYNGIQAFADPNVTLTFTANAGGNYETATDTLTITIYDGQGDYGDWETGADRRIPVNNINATAFNSYARASANSYAGLKRHYKQTGNITLTANWTAIGTSSNTFTGSYDGGGHTITNMIVRGASYQGMFGYISGGTVKNVGLVGGSVTATGTGNTNSGGVAGFIANLGVVSHCYNTGTVTSGGDFIGGIVGYINQTGGTLLNCYATGRVSGVNYTGGVIGGIRANGMIENCYAINEVISTGYSVGGIIGGNGNSQTGSTGGTVQNCVALNKIVETNTETRVNEIGRVEGYNNSGTLANNYAWSDMPVTTSGTWTPKATLSGKDGADINDTTLSAAQACLSMFVVNAPDLNNYLPSTLALPIDLSELASVTVTTSGSGFVVTLGTEDGYCWIGDTVKVTATPDVGWAFAYWTDENSEIVSYDAEYSIKVEGAITLTAVFVEDDAPEQAEPRKEPDPVIVPDNDDEESTDSNGDTPDDGGGSLDSSEDEGQTTTQ